MARVTWSDEALRRLNVISAYMDLVSLEQTDVLLKRITEAAQRATLCEGYRVAYEVLDDVVTITTVLHTSMDVEGRLRTLLEES